MQRGPARALDVVGVMVVGHRVGERERDRPRRVAGDGGDGPHLRVGALGAGDLDHLPDGKPVAGASVDDHPVRRGGGEARHLPGMPAAGRVGVVAALKGGGRAARPVVVRVALDEDQLVRRIDLVAAGVRRGGRDAVVGAVVDAQVESVARVDAVPRPSDRLLQREQRVTPGAGGLAREIERLHRPLLREEGAHHHADDEDRHHRADHHLDQCESAVFH